MYLYLFMLFLTASLRNDALGGLTYIIPDDYYQLNAYDFGNLSAGLVMDDNGMSYVEGFYLLNRDSTMETSQVGYGHIRFNNNKKFALNVKFNDTMFNWPWATDAMGNPYNYKINFLDASAEIALRINDKTIGGIGGEKNNYKGEYTNDFPSLYSSFTRINGSILYLNTFNMGSRIEYMNIKGDFYEIPYKRITATLYSLIPITDNFKVAGRLDGLRDTTQYFKLKIRSEFTPMKEITIEAEIMAANLIESDSLSHLYLPTSYLYKINNQSLTLGIGYKKDPIFVGIENCIEKWDTDIYSISRLGAEVHKKGMYIRAGMNTIYERVNRSSNFSFGLGYNKGKIDIDYLYNYGERWYWFDYSRGGTNALSIRMKF